MSIKKQFDNKENNVNHTDASQFDNMNASISVSKEQFTALIESAGRLSAVLNELGQVQEKLNDKFKPSSEAIAFFTTFENNLNYLGEKELNYLQSLSGVKEYQKKKTEILKDHTAQHIVLANLEMAHMLALAKTEDQLVSSRANVVTKSYSAMGDQMRKYVELHQFSGKVFAAAVTEQVKTELIGLSARASVWALFETAMGLATLFTAPAVSGAHFAAAGEFALISGAALAGAMGVQSLLSNQLNAGSSSAGAGAARSLASGGNAPPLSLSSTQTNPQQAQNITVVINNPLSDQNWQKIVEENIVPALNSAADKNITIAYA